MTTFPKCTRFYFSAIFFNELIYQSFVSCGFLLVVSVFPQFSSFVCVVEFLSSLSVFVQEEIRLLSLDESQSLDP